MRMLAANDFLTWLDTGKLAIIIGAVTALTGTLFGPVLAARSASATAVHQHELNVGDERRGDRKALYVELLLFLTKCNVTIRYTSPVVGLAGDPDPPPWPADDSVHMLEAQIGAYASKPIREAMNAWLDARRLFMHAAWLLSRPAPPHEAWDEIEKHRARLYELNDEIRNHVNAELSASLPV